MIKGGKSFGNDVRLLVRSGGCYCKVEMLRHRRHCGNRLPNASAFSSLRRNSQESSHVQLLDLPLAIVLPFASPAPHCPQDCRLSNASPCNYTISRLTHHMAQMCLRENTQRSCLSPTSWPSQSSRSDLGACLYSDLVDLPIDQKLDGLE